MSLEQRAKPRTDPLPSHARRRSIAADLTSRGDPAAATAVLLQAPGGPASELATVLMLAALFSRLGRDRDALGWLHDACRRFPFEPPTDPQANRPELIRVRSPRWGAIDLTGGAPAPALRLQIGRGHFSTEWLLDASG